MRTTTWIGCAAIALGALATAGTADAATKTVTINAIDANGVGQAIGTLKLQDTRNGLFIEPSLSKLPAGAHGFHVHTNPNCGPGAGADGRPAAGLAAAGHYDPKDTKKHRGPHSEDSHLGDLPVLVVDADGTAKLPVLASRLKLKDAIGRSIMIHAGGDNYDDQPAALGGGGGRIACGVVK